MLIVVTAIIAIIFGIQLKSTSEEKNETEFTPLTVGDKDNEKKDHTSSGNVEGETDSNTSKKDNNSNTVGEDSAEDVQAQEGNGNETTSYSDGSELVIVIGEDEELAGE